MFECGACTRVCTYLCIVQGQGKELGFQVCLSFEAGFLVGLGARPVARKPQKPCSLHLSLRMLWLIGMGIAVPGLFRGWWDPNLGLSCLPRE